MHGLVTIAPTVRTFTVGDYQVLIHATDTLSGAEYEGLPLTNFGAT